MEAEFSHLTDFVQKRASLANTAHESLLVPNEFVVRVKKGSGDLRSIKPTSLATQSSNGLSSTPNLQRSQSRMLHSEFLCPNACFAREAMTSSDVLNSGTSHLKSVGSL